MSERFRPFSAVYLLLIKHDAVLLLRRFNTGWQDGSYSLVSGHIEGDETVRTAMIREAKEEAGITIQPDDLQFAHVMHRKASDREYIDFFFAATKWEGEPQNMEPAKCDHLEWFPLGKLPDNILPNVKQVIEDYTNKRYFSEAGW